MSLNKSPMKRLIGVYRFRVLPFVMKLLLRPGARYRLIRLGSDYGGWWVPEYSLRPDLVAYCAGAGEDISFDLELYSRGLRVVVFDPTPRAVEHVKKYAPEDEKFQFLPIGWWNSSTTLKFFVPDDDRHVSHSAVNLQGTTAYFQAKVSSVRELAERLSHDDIEIIKMDIEGAEYVVLEDLVNRGPLPKVICVEYDQPESIWKTIVSVNHLRSCGYVLQHIEGWNYTFARELTGS